MPNVQTVATPRRVPPLTPSLSPEPCAGPSDWAGSVEDEAHILVLGGVGPELMCALLRSGARNVTHLRSHERPDAGSASLVIVPRIPSLDWLVTAMPSIRRALIANGRLVIRGTMPPVIQSQIRRVLMLHGFTAIRVSHTAGSGSANAGDQVLSAEIPAFRVHLVS